jgi:hypothetical protein
LDKGDGVEKIFSIKKNPNTAEDQTNGGGDI